MPGQRQSGYGTQPAGGYSTDRLTSYQPVDGQYSKEAYPPDASPSLGSGRGASKTKSGKKKWLWIGVPLLLLIIAGAVVGGVVGSRSSSSNSSKAAANNSASTTGSNGASTTGGGGAGTATGNPASQAFALPTLDQYGNPEYAAGTVSSPTIAASTAALDCGADDWTPSGNGVQVRPAHPRLIQAPYQWACMQKRIASDGYLRVWNATLFANATTAYNLPVANYVFDGGPSGSGVLDVARETQRRVKLWAYAYQMSNDTRWVTRAYTELYAMSGDQPGSGAATIGVKGDPWNSADHFLDCAEFTFAYALAYDWMYAGLTADQRTTIVGWINTNGLAKGVAAYPTNPFWTTATGNWNCVCTNGLMAGALAISDVDTTGNAARILTLTIPNAKAYCAQAIANDGTWLETQDYWYFGITGHSTISANLISATGSDQGFLTANPALNLTGLFHMYGTGFVQKFNWGDCGPNKYTATANSLLLYGRLLQNPVYSLYQRDRLDARNGDPFAMAFYDVYANGTWWDNLPLDHYFNNVTVAWASMRGSWTDTNAIYTAIKAGSPEDKQTHSDLDAGDFVLEALGQRWFGELCQDQYLAPGYFSSELQNAQRWTYYRCSTAGQNTIQLGGANQLVGMLPPTNYGSTNDVQTSLNSMVPASSAVYFTADLTSAYGSNIQRGLRMVAGRQAVLLRDELTGTTATAQWRANTNATLSMSGDARTCTMTLNGQTLIASIRSPTGVTFGTAQPRAANPVPDELAPDPGTTVLTIDLPAGTNTVELLFAPSWNGTTFNAGTIPSVPLAQWTTTSHPST